MTDPGPTDADLVERILKGDEPAFTALMRRHKAWLYQFVRRHAQTSEDAYDIVQDTFASAWGALKGYDRSRPFDIWLRRIALNKCRDRGRREAVRRAALRLMGRPEEQVAPVAERSEIQNATLKRLQTALDALPVRYREAITLTALQGLSQKDAAEVLGVTVKVVELRVYRAKQRLAAGLDRSDIADIAEID